MCTHTLHTHTRARSLIDFGQLQRCDDSLRFERRKSSQRSRSFCVVLALCAVRITPHLTSRARSICPPLFAKGAAELLRKFATTMIFDICNTNTSLVCCICLLVRCEYSRDEFVCTRDGEPAGWCGGKTQHNLKYVA